MSGSFRIGRILGIPVVVNPSWFLLLALIVFIFGDQVYPQLFRDQAAWTSWALALGTALIFFASMVLHELGHSLIARHFDIPVRSITLFVLGAVAQTTRETRGPGQEFLLAVAGPVVSFLLAGVFMVLWFVTGMGEGVATQVFVQLWLANFAVGLFNLLPAYPMDGGRVLRSALWGLLGNQRRATHWAALVGRTFGLVLATIGVLAMLRVPGIFAAMNPITGVQFLLLGLFLNYAAGQSDAHSDVLDILSRYRVADIMTRDVPAALAGTSVREALYGPLSGYGPDRDWLLVSDGDRFVGLAPRPALQSVPEERWDTARLADVALPAGQLHAAAPDELLSEVVQRMDANGVPVFVVVDGGQVVGVLHRGQIAPLMHVRREQRRG